MIVGDSKKAVIKNIKKYSASGELNHKVETTDPVFTDEESTKMIEKFYKIRKNKPFFALKKSVCNLVISMVDKKVTSDMEIIGLEKLDGFKGGAIVTSNHFNPLDTLIAKKVIKQKFGKDLYIVSQETNLALPGFLGFLMNHQNILPLTKSVKYLVNEFEPRLQKLLDDGEFVLIYPEEEMWFNYRKPRPCKRGAYQFAAKFNAPVVSLFTEMIDKESDDNDEFKEVKYISHVLDPIYPDKEQSARANSLTMSEIDYQQKVECYESVYGKKLDYKFEKSDIAGLK